MGLAPWETLQRPVPGRTPEDLRREGWILCMRQKDRRSECDTVHTKCSDLVNSAAQPMGGEWKELRLNG